MLGEQNGVPLRAIPTYYMITYMMVQTRQSKRRLHDPSQKVHASRSGPMLGVISQQVGPAVPVIIPGQ